MEEPTVGAAVEGREEGGEARRRRRRPTLSVGLGGSFRVDIFLMCVCMYTFFEGWQGALFNAYYPLAHERLCVCAAVVEEGTVDG